MNSITPQSLKKLLITLGFSMSIIILFLILKVFLHEEKDLVLKSFDNNNSLTTQTSEKKEPLPEENLLKEKRFLLLPAK